jgi:hypothetical protein
MLHKTVNALPENTVCLCFNFWVGRTKVEVIYRKELRTDIN